MVALTACTIVDQSLSPSVLAARTRTPYAVPFVRPVMSNVRAVSALVSPERSVHAPHVLLVLAGVHVSTEVLVLLVVASVPVLVLVLVLVVLVVASVPVLVLALVLVLVLLVVALVLVLVLPVLVVALLVLVPVHARYCRS